MKSPFKFLDPYQLEDKDAFFGREAETKELYNLVTKNRLTFVYGPSGTGKTSLVQCGLAGRFGGVDWLPIFVRRGDDINAALLRETGKALGEGPGFAGDIPAAVGALFNRYLRPVYLIFDQFEELFILGNAAEQQIFYDTIAELLEAELPCRILFILREDYFGHLNQFEKTVPELYHRKLRVEPMSRDNLRAVITGSCKVFNIGFDDARRSPELIMDNIMADKSGIHMPYVQVYLHMLYQEAIKSLKFDSSKFEEGDSLKFDSSKFEGGDSLKFDSSKFEVGEGVRFTDEVIRTVGPITDVLGRFLQEQKTLIFKNLQQDTAFAELPEDAVSQVLDVFVSKEGTKVPVGYTLASDGRPALSGEAARVLAVLPPTLVSATLLELEKSRILRRSDDTLELAHDTLAAIIDQQRSVELRQLRDIRQRIETGWREHTESLKSAHEYYFDKGQLARIEPFLPKLALEPEQADFLKKSRVEAERLENAEKERVARELQLAEEKLAAEQQAREREQQLAEEKLAAEERARKRQRFFTRVVAGVAVLALGAAILAFFQTQKANSATAAAEASATNALAAQQAAQDSAAVARAQRAAAVSAKATADQKAEDARRSAEALAKTLFNLGKTTAQVVDAICAEAGQGILKMDYPAAAAKLKATAALHKPTQAFRQAVQEVAFFWTEVGKQTQAAALLRDTKLGAPPETRAALRAWLKKMDAGHYRELENRYFGDMVPIKGGTFKIGKGDKNEGTDATVSDFHIARTETTFWQYGLFCAALGRDIGEQAEKSWGYEGHDPIINVTWYDAVEYANWLSVLRGLKPAYTIDSLQQDTLNKSDYDDLKWTVRPVPGADGYRLPAEAEWEYAARGGQEFEYSGSDNPDEVAWYTGNSSRTRPVKTRKANGYGLYDMSGNVWEWCWDWYAAYPEPFPVNYRGPDSGGDRVHRDGGWLDGPANLRVRNRDDNTPGYRGSYIGFRLVRPF